MAANPKPERKKLAKDAKIVRKIEKKDNPNKSVRKAVSAKEGKEWDSGLKKTKSGKIATHGYKYKSR